jgi:hypothetical protein
VKLDLWAVSLASAAGDALRALDQQLVKSSVTLSSITLVMNVKTCLHMVRICGSRHTELILHTHQQQTYTQKHQHTHNNTHARTYQHAHINTHTHTRTNTHSHTYITTFITLEAETQWCLHTHTCTHTYIYTCHTLENENTFITLEAETQWCLRPSYTKSSSAGMWTGKLSPTRIYFLHAHLLPINKLSGDYQFAVLLLMVADGSN